MNSGCHYAAVQAGITDISGLSEHRVLYTTATPPHPHPFSVSCSILLGKHCSVRLLASVFIIFSGCIIFHQTAVS